jgi:hypothetical protein
MKKTLIYGLLINVFILFLSNTLYALGDGSSCSTDMPASSGLANFQEEWKGNSLIFTVGTEYVDKKHFKEDDGAVGGLMSGTWYLVGLGYRIADTFEPYIRIGFSDLEMKWGQNYNDVKIEGDMDFAIGGGMKVLAYKTRLTTLAQLKVNVDGQVRYTDPSHDVTFGGATRSVSAADFWLFEGRAAATAGIEISLKKLSPDEEDIIDISLVPYVGMVYTNSLMTAEFDDGGTHYGYGKTQQKYQLNMITGLDIVAPKYVTFNAEAEWFNDRSYSGGVNIKF